MLKRFVGIKLLTLTLHNIYLYVSSSNALHSGAQISLILDSLLYLD